MNSTVSYCAVWCTITFYIKVVGNWNICRPLIKHKACTYKHRHTCVTGIHECNKKFPVLTCTCFKTWDIHDY